MCKLRIFTIIWCLLSAWIYPCAAEGFSPSGELFKQLEALKAGYESYLLKNATIPFQESFKALNTKAISALERESDVAAQRKDLELLARIKKEIERMKSGQILIELSAEAPQIGSTVYVTYKREFSRIEATWKTNKADAAGRYDTGLKQLQDQLTSSKEVDAALHVKAVRDELVKTRNEEISVAKGEDNKEGMKKDNTSPSSISLGEQMPTNWSYYTDPEGAALGWVKLTNDGKAEFAGMQKNANTGALESKVTLGTWSKGKKTNQFSVTFPGYTWDVQIENGIGIMDTRIGTRYLKPTK